MKIKLIRNRIIFLLLMMLFLSGTIFYTKQGLILQPIMLAIPIIMIPIIAFFRNIKFQVDYSTMIVFMFFSFLCIISSFTNANLILLARTGILFLSFTACSVLIPSILHKGYNGNQLNEIIARVTIYSHYPLILIPLLIRGLALNSYNAYQGMFYNPNALALVLVSLFSIEFAKLLSTLEDRLIRSKKDNIKNVIFNLILLSIIFILTIFTRSRTGVVIILFLISSMGILLIQKAFKKGKIRISTMQRLFVLFLIICIFVLLVLTMTPFLELFNAQIISKFQLRSGDITDGRSDVWIRAIQEGKLFGHGRNFFEGTVTAHNTYISILAQYGLLPLVFFLVVMLQILLKTYKYTMYALNDKYRYFPLTICITFLLTSMMEGMLYKLSMFLLFTCYGICVLNLKSRN